MERVKGTAKCNQEIVNKIFYSVWLMSDPQCDPHVLLLT